MKKFNMAVRKELIRELGKGYNCTLCKVLSEDGNRIHTFQAIQKE